MLLLYSGTFSFWISVFVAYTLNITAVEIQSIDITISCGMTGYSWYPDPVLYDTHWTLWYNSEIYQFTVPSGTCDALSYSPTDFIVHDHCSTDQHICSTEPCIMIESPIGNNDTILIDEVRFWTSEVTWYGISGRCMDDTLLSLQPWLDLDNDYYDPYYENYLGCASGQSNTWICIDDRDESCRPRKPILYFDLERPNQYIMDAVWSDGTNVFPETYSCDPTNQPIFNTSNSTTDSETEYVLEEAEVLQPHIIAAVTMNILFGAVIAICLVLGCVICTICFWKKKRANNSTGYSLTLSTMADNDEEEEGIITDVEITSLMRF